MLILIVLVYVYERVLKTIYGVHILSDMFLSGLKSCILAVRVRVLLPNP